MKFCPVVPEICRGQVHASRKERRRRIIIKIIIICLGDLINNKKRSKNNKSLKLCLGDLIIRNGAKTIICLGDLIRNGTKTISPPNLFGRLNNNKKQSKNNKSPNVVWET